MRGGDLYDVDLDADLTPEERAIIAATPFSSLAKIAVTVFILFLVISLISLNYSRNRSARERAGRLLETAAEIQASAATATPMELLALIDRWGTTFRMSADVSAKLAESLRLPAQLNSAGLALVQRGLAHLNSMEYLEPVEAAEIAVRLHDLTQTPAYGLAAGVNVVELNRALQRVVEYGTKTALDLGGPTASAVDVRRAASILTRLAQLVEPGLATEYVATANALIERANAMEQRAETLAMLGEGDVGVQRRIEFAGMALSALQGMGLNIQRVSAEGPEYRTLVIQGPASVRELVTVFLNDPDIRQRLINLGFVRVQGVGTDGSQTFSIQQNS